VDKVRQGSDYLHAEWSYLSTFFQDDNGSVCLHGFVSKNSDNALPPDPSFMSKAAILAELGYLASDTVFYVDTAAADDTSAN